MRITLHLLAFKLINHSFFHLSRAWRSSCNCFPSSGRWITLYSRLSSAKRRTFESEHSGVSFICQEEQRDKYSALWNTRQYIFLSGYGTFEDNLLFPITKESFNPAVDVPSAPIEVQFVKQSGVGHFVKSLLKIEKDHINLVAIRKVSCRAYPIIFIRGSTLLFS